MTLWDTHISKWAQGSRRQGRVSRQPFPRTRLRGGPQYRFKVPFGRINCALADWTCLAYLGETVSALAIFQRPITSTALESNSNET
jgi:hypothetical protein